MRWWEYLPHFNYDTIHIDGERNRVADALSYYLNMTLSRISTLIKTSSKLMKF